MSAPTQEDLWRVAKHMYITGTPLRDVANSVGVPVATLKRRVNVEDWAGDKERFDALYDDRLVELIAIDTAARIHTQAKQARMLRQDLFTELEGRIAREGGLADLKTRDVVKLYVDVVKLEREVLGLDVDQAKSHEVDFSVLVGEATEVPSEGPSQPPGLPAPLSVEPSPLEQDSIDTPLSEQDPLDTRSDE